MKTQRISIAGISTLLGQKFLERSLQSTEIIVQSLHDPKVQNNTDTLATICDWSGSNETFQAAASLPLLPSDATSAAQTLVSFLPDPVGEDIESLHLAKGTRVVTHCEYARLTAPMVMPGVTQVVGDPPLSATPNCTTAICASPLAQLHQSFGVSRVTITTMQAISGTDLPGIPAFAIHDQVIGHLGGEAEALSQELSILFDANFPVDTFATRVPVWRGHTITLAVDLKVRPDLPAVQAALSGSSAISFQDTEKARRRFPADAPLTTIVNLRLTDRGVLLVIEGDNLEAATVGVMFDTLRQLF